LGGWGDWRLFLFLGGLSPGGASGVLGGLGGWVPPPFSGVVLGPPPSPLLYLYFSYFYDPAILGFAFVYTVVLMCHSHAQHTVHCIPLPPFLESTYPIGPLLIIFLHLPHKLIVSYDVHSDYKTVRVPPPEIHSVDEFFQF